MASSRDSRLPRRGIRREASGRPTRLLRLVEARALMTMGSACPAFPATPRRAFASRAPRNICLGAPMTAWRSATKAACIMQRGGLVCKDHASDGHIYATAIQARVCRKLFRVDTNRVRAHYAAARPREGYVHTTEGSRTSWDSASVSHHKQSAVTEPSSTPMLPVEMPTRIWASP